MDDLLKKNLTFYKYYIITYNNKFSFGFLNICTSTFIQFATLDCVINIE